MKPMFNRAPLNANFLSPLPLGAIKPEGWLLDQLRTQAEGLSGKLYKIWDDVNEKSAWLGGEGDGWERAPYYLDGLIPLAWELDDEELKGVCQKYIEWILGSAREDGWFGPEKNDDYWPLMVALKALRQYFTATNDKRVLVLMDNFFKYEYRSLADKPMKDWAVARGGENIELALWLYNLTGQEYLLKLCQKLRAQTLDWANYFHTFPNASPMSRSMKWERLVEGQNEEKSEGEYLIGESRPYFQSQFHFSHGVNVAMGLKTPGVINLFKSGFKEQGGFRFGWEKLMKYHGVANGMFTCDEHLNGSSPTQGTELCTIVEAMYSMETLIATGDYGSLPYDALEKIAYNALPAAFSPNMNLHQYDEQVNQIRATKEKHHWYNNADDSNVFGFAPNFGCCTANYHQGWPKFVSHLWMATKDGGLSAVSYAPCTVRAMLGGVPGRITVSGGYPFAETVEITVAVKQPVEFPLYLRVPGWARQPMVYLPDGEIMRVRADDVTCVRRKWRTGDVVKLELPAVPQLTKWYHQSGAVELGPLLMAFQPREDWKQMDNGDCEVTTEDSWNWALLRDEPMKVVREEERTQAFGKDKEHHGVHVLAKVTQVDWPMDGADTAAVPMAPKAGPRAQVMELVPFGDTCLRIAQFPVCAMPAAK